MINNEHSESCHRTDRAFIRLLCLVLNERDTFKENKDSYKKTLLFLRNRLYFNACPTLTDSVRDFWIDQIHNTIMNL